jgi:hypothetical protein
MTDALEQLIAGSIPYILVGGDQLSDKTILLPGSFNPLHHGHERLLHAAEETTGRSGMLELSVTNVDKPPLEAAEVERRLDALKNRYGIVLTSAPTFAEKVELFPDGWFAMGFDTAVRLLDPAYHEDIEGMLKRFRDLGTHFVVGGRISDGKFMGVESLSIPPGFEDLFISIPERLFREDISSTQLRGE